MTRKSRPARSCRLCKPHKWWGNSRHRQKASVARRLQPEKHRDDPTDLTQELYEGHS